MLAQPPELRAKIMLTILGFLGATMLAFRFNVFILLPAILLGWMMVLVNGVLSGSSGASIALHLVLVAILLQVGYMTGIILKLVLLASRRRSWSDKPAAVPDGTF
jgi:hypothetical protein